MSYLVFLFVLFFGAVIGSFLNVVILRLNTGASLSGRSRCFTCSTQLRWFELFPVLSFFVLRGKCRSCRSSISCQYPIVELLSGALFVLTLYKITTQSVPSLDYASEATLFSQLPLMSIVVYAMLWSILLVVAVYDIRHKIIPSALVYCVAVLAVIRIVAIVLLGDGMFPPFIAALSSGLLLALPFFLIWFFSHGHAMGFGDVQLALVLGLFLTLPKAIAVFVLAFWIGGLVGIVMLALERFRLFFSMRKNSLNLVKGHVTMKSEIPFAPFLVVSFAVVFFCTVDIYSLIAVFERLWL